MDDISEDGVVRMFWIDAFDKNDGTVFLFGKVMNKETSKYVSCCLAVKNIERSLFALPRDSNLEDGRELMAISVPNLNFAIRRSCVLCQLSQGIL